MTEKNNVDYFGRVDDMMVKLATTQLYKKCSKSQYFTQNIQKQEMEFDKAFEDFKTFSNPISIGELQIPGLSNHKFDLPRQALFAISNVQIDRILSHKESRLIINPSSNNDYENKIEKGCYSKKCINEADVENITLNNSPSLLTFKSADVILKMKQTTKNIKGVYTTAHKSYDGSNVDQNSLIQKRKNIGSTFLSRGVRSKFVPPFMGKCDSPKFYDGAKESQEKDTKNSNIDLQLMEMIENEVIDHKLNITWDDIAGLDFVKSVIKEIIVWPMLRPDIFTGLRKPPRGVLLFGPPGTGKTLIGKCIASNSKATFFNISASVLTSKWIGEGEKTVRALFEVARVRQPSVIFIDEVDSLLSSRSAQGEHESSRRLKTEFLVRLDGLSSADGDQNDRLLVVGATNRPQELDEAARRRFVKRLYVPLPDSQARSKLVENLLNNQRHTITPEQLMELGGTKTVGYSGADMADLCREASLGPIRTLSADSIETINVEEMRPITAEDFERGLKRVRPSVSTDDLELYLKWNATYGCQ